MSNPLSKRCTHALVESVSDWYDRKLPESRLVLSYTNANPNSRSAAAGM